MGCQNSVKVEANNTVPEQIEQVNAVEEVQQIVLEPGQKQIDICLDPDEMPDFMYINKKLDNNVFLGIKNQFREHRAVLASKFVVELDRILSSLLEYNSVVQCDSQFTLQTYKLIMQVIYLDYPDIFWTVPKSVIVSESNTPVSLHFKPFNPQQARIQFDKINQHIDDYLTSIDQTLATYSKFKFISQSTLVFSTLLRSSQQNPNGSFYTFFANQLINKFSLPFIYYYLLISCDVSAKVVPVKRTVNNVIKFEFGVLFIENGEKVTIFGDEKNKVNQIEESYINTFWSGITITELKKFDVNVVHTSKDVQTGQYQIREQIQMPFGEQDINDIAEYISTEMKKNDAGFVDIAVQGPTAKLIEQSQAIQDKIAKITGNEAQLYVWIDQRGFLILLAKFTKGHLDPLIQKL
ncbi:Hypothetical_protein [Hexamita inflata]|uniref:Hypothetical_protein n=1 Tax=Hexamita inflata TaxID=28002 RepID=A0AA86P064_9EUKA|nr:Hypothetical protein HINF_LOCUS15701 [Hexamita inflata]